MKYLVIDVDLYDNHKSTSQQIETDSPLQALIQANPIWGINESCLTQTQSDMWIYDIEDTLYIIHLIG